MREPGLLAQIPDQLTWVAIPVLLVAMSLAFYRLLRGPTRADRAVALDQASFLAVSIMAVYAIAESEPVFVDAAIVVVLINFLATVALARYVEAAEPKEEPRDEH